MKNELFLPCARMIRNENNNDFMINLFCFANSQASDLDLHFFPLSLLLDAMQKWVNKSI